MLINILTGIYLITIFTNKKETMEKNKVRIGNYIIEKDSLNWMVTKKAIQNNKKSKNYGKEYNLFITYHADLHQATDKILDEISRENWGDIGLILSSHELVLSKLDELIKLEKK
jgi:hypothetical protein